MNRCIQLALKRAFDIVVSIAVLTLLSPLMALIALAIKLDDGGPGLYIQERVGKDGNAFRCYKFRTMVVGAPRARAWGWKWPRTTPVSLAWAASCGTGHWTRFHNCSMS